MAVLDQPTSTRKLAAILSADIAGYSAMMGADEEGTVRKLREVREAVLPIIQRFGGRIIDLAGDGILAEYPSAVRAVESAAAVQSCMGELNTQSEPKMVFRIGVNVGDVIHEGERLYGDGVNVAARLQAMSEPGGICISNKVHEEIRDRVMLAFTDMGEQKLKNIARPVRAFSADFKDRGFEHNQKVGSAPLPLLDKPSIAVLPFTNMSGDPEQEYFADGVVEEIITALSRFRSLFVIARNSSFSYKGRLVDIRQVGKDLGVQYILEGSIRKSAARIRITGQLIDCNSGTHVWADRYDGSPEDVFTLQDEITASVVGALVPQLEQAEIERSKRKQQPDLGAYDLYLRALPLHRGSIEENATAIRLLRDAEAKDPSFPLTYALAARCYIMRQGNGWIAGRADVQEAKRNAALAVKYGPDDAEALAAAAFTHAYVALELDAAAALIEKALSLNANSVLVWGYASLIKTFVGDPQAGFDYALRALRLSPIESRSFIFLGAAALALFFLKRFEEGISFARRSIAERPMSANYSTLAACYAGCGRVSEARETLAQAASMFPLGKQRPGIFRREEDFSAYRGALQVAGAYL
jgi:TolB-like protein/class 3 adenylate cyclase